MLKWRSQARIEVPGQDDWPSNLRQLKYVSEFSLSASATSIV